MSLSVLIIILSLGFVLLMIELFFLTGVLKIGIGGLIIMLIAIIFIYMYYGSEYGNIILTVSIAGSLIAFLLAFKVLERGNIGLQEVIDGKVNVLTNIKLRKGDVGEAFGDIKPVGRAKFTQKIYQVDSEGDFIEDGSQVVIIEINKQKIIVEKLNS